MLCLQVAVACVDPLDIPSFGGFWSSTPFAVICGTGTGNGQGWVIDNPNGEYLQWYWLTDSDYLNKDYNDYMEQGSQTSTTADSQAIFVAAQCPEDSCVLLFYCENKWETCKGISVTPYEGEFSSALCAQSTPIECSSLPSAGACSSSNPEYDCDGSTYGMNCCVNTGSFENLNGEFVCMDSITEEPLIQLCNILTLEPGYSASPVPHQDDYHPYEPSASPEWQPSPSPEWQPSPSPEWQPSASASPASYVPSGRQPSDGPGLFSPGPVLYGIIGVALLLVVVIVVAVVRARRHARQATTERALPLLSPQAVQQR